MNPSGTGLCTWGVNAPTPSWSINDETLRDGLQAASATDPSVGMKADILELLATVGVEHVSLGMPGRGENATGVARHLLSAISDRHLDIRPNCAARAFDADVLAISSLAQTVGLSVEAMVFIGASYVRLRAEEWTEAEVEKRVSAALSLAVAEGLPVCFVIEDATRTNPQTLDSLCAVAVEAGAARICICDTVGAATPHGAASIVRHVINKLRGYSGTIGVDWHGHNDRGLGLANALAAGEAGASRLHSTTAGIGERSGNTATDQLLLYRTTGGGAKTDLRRVQDLVTCVSDALSLPVPANYPTFGRDAFTTSTGTHAAAVGKARSRGDRWAAERVYASLPAEDLGRVQRIVVGPMSGMTAVRECLAALGLDTSEADVKRVLNAAEELGRVLTDDELRSIVRPSARR